MENKKTTITGYAQAIISIVALVGIIFSSRDTEILAGAITLIGILGGVKGHHSQDR